MEEKKSNKLKIIIGIIILVLVIAAAVIWFILSNLDKNKPEEVFYAYIGFLQNKDYESMYTLLSNSSKEKFDKETYITRNKNIYEGIEATNIEVSNVVYNKENKSLNYDMSFDTLAGKINMTNTVTFERQDDKKYYINWGSNLIFPDLKEEYKIRVYSNLGTRGKILDRNGIVLAEDGQDGKRKYPYGKITAHVVGYVRGISEDELSNHKGKGYTESSIIGKTGLELAFEEKLRGKSESGIYLVDGNENTIKAIAKTDSQNGQDIKTTIDINLQKEIYEQFKNDNGFSVAINPKNGEVLAMVSTPSFDTNKFSTGFTDEEWNELSSNGNTPMFARYESTWAPGSSFKPIIGAIGLNLNTFNENDDFGRSGTSWQKDSSWGDYKITTLTTYGGTANLRNALIFSDNIYFAKTALKIGSEDLAQYLLKIGFDKNLDFPISMLKSQFGENNKFSSEIVLADSGYGQGEMLVNPLHIASIYSSFVNNGDMIQPKIEYNEDTKYWINDAFSANVANTIQKDLIQVVENSSGTAHEAQISGVTLAGKTGTAELKASKEENGEELGWFNCFIVSDKDDEQLLTINMVENVENRGGSHYLLPKVKNIVNYYLK